MDHYRFVLGLAFSLTIISMMTTIGVIELFVTPTSHNSNAILWNKCTTEGYNSVYQLLVKTCNNQTTLDVIFIKWTLNNATTKEVILSFIDTSNSFTIFFQATNTTSPYAVFTSNGAIQSNQTYTK